MITLHNDTDYEAALRELAVIFHTNPLEGTVEHTYYYHLVDAIEEWEHINHPMN